MLEKDILKEIATKFKTAFQVLVPLILEYSNGYFRI
jgi:hypothetical protein